MSRFPFSQLHMEQVSDGQAAEMEQADLLIDKGTTFRIPKISLFQYVGKAERTFEIKPPYIRTLVYLSREMIGIDFDQKLLEENYFEGLKRVMTQNVHKAGRITAIMYLRDNWKIRLFLPFMAHYFQCRLTPATFRGITEIILRGANLSDFMISIGSLSLKKRVTAPAPMETPEEIQD